MKRCWFIFFAPTIFPFLTRRHSNLPNLPSSRDFTLKTFVDDPLKGLQTYARLVDEAGPCCWFVWAVGLAYGFINYLWDYFFGAVSLTVVLEEIRAFKDGTRESESAMKEDIEVMKAGMVRIEEFMRKQAPQVNVYKPFGIRNFLRRPGQAPTTDLYVRMKLRLLLVALIAAVVICPGTEVTATVFLSTQITHLVSIDE